jgi:ubiquinone biosynthesis protein UbiJ
MTASPAWLAAAEAMLNRNLDESAQAPLIARHLEGRSLRVEVASLISIRASVHSGRLLLGSGATEPADAVISGNAAALLNLLKHDASHPSRTAAAQVRGDAEVANRFRELLKLARPDLEAEISRFIGEMPARALAQAARLAFHWSRRAPAGARANIAEYLQEESRDLVNKTELDEFLRGVDRAREAADRAEARLAQLERRLRSAS